MTRSDTDWRGGVLLIDKPSGPSSFDVVRRIRRHLGTKKVGHTGTLDPMADGLLVVCLGDATRAVPFLTAVDKTYEARVRLGLVSDTYDAEGECVRVTDRNECLTLKTEFIEATLGRFRGEIQQKPPVFSAIKIEGERAYAKARRGEAVEMPLRTVHIHQCVLQGRCDDEVSLLIRCSKGTYIRSIAHDLGQALEVGSVLVGLRRIEVGGLRVSDAVTLEALCERSMADARQMCLGVGDALPNWSRVVLSETQAYRVRTGQRLEASELPASNFLAYSAKGDLLALMKGTAENGETKILRGFPTV